MILDFRINLAWMPLGGSRGTRREDTQAEHPDSTQEGHSLLQDKMN